jgi:DNA-binding MarR family transcriptional regulator
MPTLRNDKVKILDALSKGDKTRDELLKVTSIKPTTLHHRLTFLLKSGDVETYDKPEDRRISLYRISEQRKEIVKAQVLVERAMAELDSIFKEVPVEQTKKLLGVFESWLKEQGYEVVGEWEGLKRVGVRIQKLKEELDATSMALFEEKVMDLPEGIVDSRVPGEKARKHVDKWRVPRTTVGDLSRKKKKLPKKEEPKREQKKELTWHEVFYGTK